MSGYVEAGYVIALGSLGTYAISLVRRERSVRWRMPLPQAARDPGPPAQPGRRRPAGSPGPADRHEHRHDSGALPDPGRRVGRRRIAGCRAASCDRQRGAGAATPAPAGEPRPAAADVGGRGRDLRRRSGFSSSRVSRRPSSSSRPPTRPSRSGPPLGNTDFPDGGHGRERQRPPPERRRLSLRRRVLRCHRRTSRTRQPAADVQARATRRGRRPLRRLEQSLRIRRDHGEALGPYIAAHPNRVKPASGSSP